MCYFTFFEIRAQFVKAGRFLPWTRPDIMSLYLIHTALHTACVCTCIVISIYANRTINTVNVMPGFFVKHLFE